MNIVSSNMISDNFVATYNGITYTKDDLIEKIKLWKYLLRYKCSAKKGESLLIGITVLSIDYVALCIAAAELSLKIVIVDYSRDFIDLDFFDSKTRLLSPINIFLHNIRRNDLSEDVDNYTKFHFFKQCSERSYNIYEDIDKTIEEDKFAEAQTVLPNPSDILMRCTSSGTTGTPKIVEHTHEFLAKISERNADKFSGECVHIKNLNHGSSLAVFFLPSLISDKVTNHILYHLDEDEDEEFNKFVDDISKYQTTLEYIIFPYPFMIDKFIDLSNDRNIKWPNLNVQTLSYIQQKPKDAIKYGVIKSITSIFGSNETSGPVFELTIDQNNLDQDSSYFKKKDNFFDITLENNGMVKIGLPYYNSYIITNDVFQQEGEYYIHKGRNDILKINGEIIDINVINDLNANNTNSYLITDTVQNCLYLAYWDKEDQTTEDKFNEFFKQKYPRIKINKSAVLTKRNFLTGIKIDNELLREYFRTHV